MRDTGTGSPGVEEAVLGLLRPWGRLCLYDPDGGRVLAHLMVYPHDGVREVAQAVGLCKSDVQKTISRINDTFPQLRILLHKNTTISTGQQRRRKRERRTNSQ